MTDTTPKLTSFEAVPRTVRELLTGRRYGLGYYQRQYVWQERNVAELLDDLTSAFLLQFDSKHSRRAVATYRPYFLGALVTSQRDGVRFVIDGQQRLTTLLLLLLVLEKHLPEQESNDLKALVFTRQYGEAAFALDVPERRKCMEAILADAEFDISGTDLDTRNVWMRSRDIDRLISDDVLGDVLPYFVDWVTERVTLVEISTDSDVHAYEIFESMNDRGVSLAPADMLKGYLLASIDDERQRSTAAERWEEEVQSLAAMGPGLEADFIKTWLVGRFAETMKPRRKSKGEPRDFDAISRAFHRWVRENSSSRMNLAGSDGFYRLVHDVAPMYAGVFRRVLHVSDIEVDGHQAAFGLSCLGQTAHLVPVMAAVGSDESPIELERKLRMVMRFSESVFVRRAIGRRMKGASNTYEYRRDLFEIARSIRGLDTEILCENLMSLIAREPSLDQVADMFLDSSNRTSTKYILARLTSYLDSVCGVPQTLGAYLRPLPGHPGYEIEHVLSRPASGLMVPDPRLPRRNRRVRDSVGSLVLLPRGVNQSLGATSYSAKRDVYSTQNSLAQSLHPAFYKNNPRISRFLAESDIAMQPWDLFDEAAIENRCAVYRDLARRVWDPHEMQSDASLSVLDDKSPDMNFLDDVG